jgi:Tol biopolymer transport system component
MIALLLDNDVWISNLDGTGMVQLTVDGNDKFNLRWLPDRETIAYISGGCINSVTIEGVQDYIACFEIAEFFEGFDVSPDGTKIAISLNRELFVVDFDLVALQAARFRTHLIALAPCEHFAPYDRGTNVAAKGVEFSKDGTRIAVLRIAVGLGGTQVDQIDIIDITNCVELPIVFDGFPGTRFQITNNNIYAWDWDGEALTLMNNFVRNDGFGDLYLYNQQLRRGELINPIGGSCCYTGPEWSPDGRYIFFAYQDRLQGENSETIFYFVAFATLNGGGQIVPMSFDPVTDSRDLTEAAFRPAAAP